MADNLLRKTLVALADAGVEFVVCGGVACILQGVARATHDLDVRVALHDSNLERFVQAARQLGLVPRIPEPLEALTDSTSRRIWIEDKHAIVYTLLTPSGDFAVDLFLQYPVPMEDLSAGADSFEIDGRTIKVSSKLHLIEAKRAVEPARKKDLRDIEDLLELIHG